jgi:hypothetical protein
VATIGTVIAIAFLKDGTTALLSPIAGRVLLLCTLLKTPLAANLTPVPVTICIGDLIPPPQSTDKEELQAVTTQCAAVINQMHALGR